MFVGTDPGNLSANLAPCCMMRVVWFCFCFDSGRASLDPASNCGLNGEKQREQPGDTHLVVLIVDQLHEKQCSDSCVQTEAGQHSHMFAAGLFTAVGNATQLLLLLHGHPPFSIKPS